jgi:hypothetical protein
MQIPCEKIIYETIATNRTRGDERLQMRRNVGGEYI